MKPAAEMERDNEALRARLTRLSQASLRINESLDYPTVLQRGPGLGSVADGSRLRGDDLPGRFGGTPGLPLFGDDGLRKVRDALSKAGYRSIATGDPEEVPGLMEEHRPRDAGDLRGAAGPGLGPGVFLRPANLALDRQEPPPKAGGRGQEPHLPLQRVQGRVSSGDSRIKADRRGPRSLDSRTAGGRQPDAVTRTMTSWYAGGNGTTTGDIMNSREGASRSRRVLTGWRLLGVSAAGGTP